jgi:hypothetical protein
MQSKVTPEDLIDSAIMILQSNKYFDTETQEDNRRIVSLILKRVMEMVTNGADPA